MKWVFNFGSALLAFSSFCGCSSVGYQSPRYVKLAHEITASTAKKLEEEKKLYLIGTGGRMMYDIKMMAMTFNYYCEVDLKRARELIVFATNEYLGDINNNQEIRPYLHEYPFNAKNVDIMIFVYHPDRSELPPEKSYCITSWNGVVKYYTRCDRDHPIFKETYEEALNEVAL